VTTTAHDVARVRTRVRAVLITGQVLAGLGMGSVLSVGALLVTQVAGSPALSGMAATMSTVGAAIAAIPLAYLASKRGRAPALTTGALIAAAGAALGIVAAILNALPLLLAAIVFIGVGTAVNLQSRFAATDLSEPNTRGRDLALVVWATTIGAVGGPNLIDLGDHLGRSIGLPALSGPFIFTIVAQLVAATVYFFGLRPDPLKLAASLSAAEAKADDVAVSTHDPAGVRTGMIAIALSHAMMVSVMSMTPVHLTEHGATLVIVGITISLHVAGMFGLSPVFGILSDRLGRLPVIGIGQGLLVASLLTTSFGAESEGAVVTGLILLGLGWSASTVAGSALIAQSADPAHRTRTQGRADLLMSAAGAAGGALAGPVLAWIGYSGLSLIALTLVAVVLAALAVRIVGLRDRTPQLG
jgi:MFS family permease